MRLALLTAAALLGLPLAAQAEPRPDSLYAVELRHQCAGKHLEQMTAGDLDLIMEDFGGTLSKTQVRVVQDAVGRRCARIEGGLSCGNAATLSAYRRLGVLKAFVRRACASGWTCQGFANCTQTTP